MKIKIETMKEHEITLLQITSEELSLLVEDATLNAIEKILSKSPQAFMPTPPKGFINVDEACKLLDLAKQTIYGLVCRKKIPHIKQGKILRFKRSELVDWVESGRV